MEAVSTPGVDTPNTDAIPQAFKISHQVFLANLPCRVVKPHQKNPNYVGRADIRERIQQRLAPRAQGTSCQQWYALCGLGGVGKTQAALNYTFENMETFEAVLWAHADTRGKLLESFANFAIELGLMNEGDSNLTGRDLLKEWFATTGTSSSKPYSVLLTCHTLSRRKPMAFDIRQRRQHR